MAQPVWSERSRKLQESFSTSALPSLPMMVPRPAIKQKYHKLQRFGVSAAGRTEKSEIVSTGLKNFSVQEKLRVVPTTQDIYRKKHELVREWESLEEEERRRQPTTSPLKAPSRNNQQDDIRGDMGLPHTTLAQSASAPALACNLRLPPRWLEFDREVLRFFLYFKEAVHESPNECFRVRKCSLLYYLNDGTIQIEEPKEENSGLPQGVFLKRTTITKDDDVTTYEPQDFMIGTQRTIYGRTFRVVDMDDKTRNFLSKQGCEVPSAEPYPVDSYAQLKLNAAKPRAHVESITGAKPRGTLGQYLKNDSKVLRFNCVWDDSERLYGERNDYSLTYFLSDDSIEMRNKSKREPFPLLLKRQKLPRNMDDPNEGHYSAADLRCGQFINCFKRPLLLLSCDSFTEKFYERVYDFKQMRVKLKTTPPVVVKTQLPPYNGFGGEADSLANCINLVPKPVKQDLHRFLNNSGKELRFRAQLTNPDPEEVSRGFVITYFMDDDTVAVYEPPQRNSGIMGGKFLERGKYKKAGNNTGKPDMVSELEAQVRDKVQSREVGGPYNLLRAFKNQGCDDTASLITYEQFKLALRAVGFTPQAMSDDDVLMLFQRHDVTHDSRINCQDFVKDVMVDPATIKAAIKVENNYSTSSADSITKNISGNTKTDKDAEDTKPNAPWYRASDFYVGARISLTFSRTGASTQEFEIVSADNQTLELMESNPTEFKKSNVTHITQSLASVLAQNNVQPREVLRNMDVGNNGWVKADAFMALLKNWANQFGLTEEADFTDHEALTLTRAYDARGDGKVVYSEFCDAVLAKKAAAVPEEEPKVDDVTLALLGRLDGLRESNARRMFKGLDTNCSGRVTWNELQQALFDKGMELSDDELTLLMIKFDQDCDGSVNYDEFCDVLYGGQVGKARDDAADEQQQRLNALNNVGEKQKRLKTPTMSQYKQILFEAQRKEDQYVSIRNLMKAFSSGFFVRKLTLRKNFLAFDLDNHGTIAREQFEEAMVRTNADFPLKTKNTLLEYLFTRDDQVINYSDFMDIMFKNDVASAVRLYGTLL